MVQNNGYKSVGESIFPLVMDHAKMVFNIFDGDLEGLVKHFQITQSLRWMKSMLAIMVKSQNVL